MQHPAHPAIQKPTDAEAPEVEPLRFDARDYKNDLRPIWCPGCGDFGVLMGIQRALAAIGKPPHEIAFISGIGCSGRISGYVSTYGFNTVHGRALPIAQGVKLANPEMLVLVAGGDGDGFSIGGGHIPHAARRNLDITYLVLDNAIYGLTKGQLSPTSRRGLETSSSPWGSLEEPVNPLLYVLSYGARYVAQGTPADMNGLAQLIEDAIRFPGFSFVNIHTPCVTFGEIEDQVKAQKERMHNLQELGHDTSDRAAAMKLALEERRESRFYTGVLYREDTPEEELSAQFAARRKAVQQELGLDGPLDRSRVLEMFRPGR